MIGAYSSPGYAGTSGVDIFLFLASIPFGICDLYYSYRDYSCVWVPIAKYNIKFDLQLWLRVDGGVLLGMAALILLFGLILCCYPTGCQGLFWFHNVLTFIFALFRVAWLIIGSLMFWGYLNKFPLCDDGVRRYMWANLIIGFILSVLYFFLPCLCGSMGRSAGYGLTQQRGPVIGAYNSGGTYGTGTNLAFPLPPVTPSYRETHLTNVNVY